MHILEEYWLKILTKKLEIQMRQRIKKSYSMTRWDLLLECKEDSMYKN